MADVARVAVLIDYNNARLFAHDCFRPEEPRESGGEFWPLTVARVLASGSRIAAREDRRLVRVEVFEGEPPEHWPEPYYFFTRKAQKWQRQGVRVTTLPVQLRGGRRLQKGIDVEMGCAAMEIAEHRLADVIVMFTADNDLAPVVRRMAPWASGRPRVELAAWHKPGMRTAMQVDGVPLHWLTAEDYARAACNARCDFGRPSSRLLEAIKARSDDDTTMAAAFRKASVPTVWEPLTPLEVGSAADVLAEDEAPGASGGAAAAQTVAVVPEIRRVVLDGTGIGPVKEFVVPPPLADPVDDMEPAAEGDDAAVAAPVVQPPRRRGLWAWLRRRVDGLLHGRSRPHAVDVSLSAPAEGSSPERVDGEDSPELRKVGGSLAGYPPPL